LLLLLISACKSDDTVARALLPCDGPEIRAAADPSCCIAGFESAAPGEVLVYQYTSNINEAAITWSVVSGAITIESGQNTDTVRLIFATNFSGGEISCTGKAGELCLASAIIAKQ
jgi:hypothetical protein